MNKKELASNLLEALNLEGFNEVNLGPGAIILQRQNVSCIDRIVISYNTYLSEYVLAPYVTGWKFIIPIEEILAKVTSQENNYTIYHISSRAETLTDKRIANYQDIEHVASKVKQLITDEIFPFFNTFNSLEKIHKQIESLEVNRISNFVANPFHPKLMTLKRLINTDDWEDYCEETIAMYKEQAQGKYKAVFAPTYAFLPNLYDQLKNLDLSELT